MPFATFEGERSVEEIADRLYTRLTPKQRETATAALIRANPRLERIGEVERGVVLDVPDIPALRAKITAENQSPDRQVLQLLAAAVKAHGERVSAQQARDEAEIKAETAAIKSTRFTRAIAKSEDLVALAAETRAAIESRAKDAAPRQKALSAALEKASADIEERLNKTPAKDPVGGRTSTTKRET